MFAFKIKDNSTAIDIVVTRALLALCAIVVLIYRTESNFAVNILVAVSLFITSLFIKMLLLRFRIDKIFLAGIAAFLVFVATHSVAFAVVLLLHAVSLKFLYKQPVVKVDEDGVALIKMIGSNNYDWESFTNIVLKDNLLTIDFKNNKLLQLTIEENTAANEKQFNHYCTVQLKK
jgi:hypothetical protein